MLRSFGWRSFVADQSSVDLRGRRTELNDVRASAWIAAALAARPAAMPPPRRVRPRAEISSFSFIPVSAVSMLACLFSYAAEWSLTWFHMQRSVCFALLDQRRGGA
jgi:hypothetical protein